MKTPATVNLVVIALLLVLSAMSVAADPAIKNPLAVRLNGKEVSRDVVVVELGNIIPSYTKRIDLEVVNTGDGVAHIALFASGSKISAAWGPDALVAGMPSNVAELRPGVSAALQVNLAATEQNDLQVLNLTWLGQLVFQIAFDYHMFQKENIDLEVPTGALSSGRGKDSSWYQVCAGPSPEGYSLESHKFEIVRSGRERACNRWVECKSLDPTPENGVCYDFGIQGHSEMVLGVEEKTSTWAEGKLTVHYHLKTSEPQLSD